MTEALSPRTWGGPGLGIAAVVLFVAFCVWVVVQRRRSGPVDRGRGSEVPVDRRDSEDERVDG